MLSRPRVKITELHFIGKETVLQEEIESGIVSEQEAEAYRFIITPERDPIAELVFEVLRLLSKAELKQLNVSRREADKIKNSDGSITLQVRSKQSRLIEELVNYLHKHYPEEVGSAKGEDALQAFVTNRKDILEHWQAIQPTLKEMPTKDLMEIAECSRRNAERIKYGQVEPRFETIRRIVAFYRR